MFWGAANFMKATQTVTYAFDYGDSFSGQWSWERDSLLQYWIEKFIFIFAIERRLKQNCSNAKKNDSSH